jgi:type VI secretion system secreted protein VgrG
MHESGSGVDRASLDGETAGAEAAGAQAFRLVLGPFGGRALRVLRVRGREALSRPYAWAVTFTTSEPSFAAATVLGQAARLTIGPLAEVPREVCGVVDAIEGCAGTEHGRRAYRARLVPRLALLSRRRTSRVFEGRTVPQMLAAVLEAGGVAHRFETGAAYVPRAYCVQYQETDLAFVRRLCAEAGIWFRFDAPEKPEAADASERVTFGDSDAAPELDGGERLALRPSHGSALRGEEEHVTAFEERRAVVPSALRVRGYDFRRPEAPLEARAALVAEEPDPRTCEVYEHHDRDDEAKEAESGLEGAFLGQLARGAHTARGASWCARLTPGRRFVLERPDELASPGPHVVTAVRHEGRAPRLAGEAPSYQNRFSCVPASVVPRPPRPRRKVQTVTETAIVVGPEGSEVHTDEHGRIRVRMHWQPDEHAACWARVAEAWAGASWGSQWLPRVGMEVLVAFVAGDASRPVVLGCLRNATHPAPFALPRDKTTSGIRTRSTPGGDGYNEVSFSDAKGAEVLSVRAERDFARLVQHDAQEAIGHDAAIVVGHDRATRVEHCDAWTVGERLSIEVAGTARQEMSDQTIAHATGGGAGMVLAGGDASLKARGDIRLSAGGNVAIDAGGHITIKAGGTVTIQAAGALAIVGATIRAEAGGAVVIQGGTVDLNP